MITDVAVGNTRGGITASRGAILVNPSDDDDSKIPNKKIIAKPRSSGTSVCQLPYEYRAPA